MVKLAQLDNFRVLTNEIVASAHAEPSALIYERLISQNEEVVCVYERFTNSDAAFSHLSAFTQEFGQRLLGIVERKRTLVFSAQDPKLYGNLEMSNDEFIDHLDRFLWM